jgi:hypothetical protein
MISGSAAWLTTRKGFLPGVDEFMPLEMVFAYVALATIFMRAGKWAHSCVNASVLL